MEWLDYFRFVIALAFVLGLIGVLAWLGRRSGFVVRPTNPGSASSRISIVEVRAVDAKHRLVLVRRDDAEHLILLGAGSDLLVESGIPVPEVKP